MSSSSRLHILLKSKVQSRDWPALSQWLESLSHRDFRQATMGFEQLSPKDLSADALLELFAYLVPTHPKAYLVTLLKAVVAWHKQGVLSVDHPLLLAYATQIGTENRLIDIRKFAEAIFPLIDKPEVIHQYINAFGLIEVERQMALLIAFDTMPCRYCLFLCMRQCEHDVDLLKQIVQELRKRASSRDYNFLAFVTVYFDLKVSGIVYALHLEPHELGRVEASYEHFTQMMMRV